MIYYKILKNPTYFQKECIAKLKIKDSFENCTHEPILHIILMNLPNIK